MLFTSRRERRLWSAAGLCVALIYSTLSLARPIAEELRERDLLGLVVGLFFIGIAGLIAWRLAVARPERRVVLTVALIGGIYLVLLTAIPMLPEERLHFLEYGLVAILIYEALKERRAHLTTTDSTAPAADPWPFLMAFLATLALGWIDEGIQAVLPNRVYDLRDVGFNALAGLLSLSTLRLVERRTARIERTD
jgi:VanZ family protein